MQFDADRQEPTCSGQRSACGLCRRVVVGRCGQIVRRHWAHLSVRDCDPWWEPETIWHRRWKSFAPPDRREVVIGPHRADIVTADGLIVELQHSPISPADICEREHFYGRMAWLFDGRELTDRLILHENDRYLTFTWRHPCKSWAFARRPVYLDRGDDVLHVRRLYIGHDGGPTGGWGHLLAQARFVATVLKAEPAERTLPLPFVS